MPDRAEPLRGLFSWLGRHERGALLSLLAVCGGVWLFVELADRVAAGRTESLDRRILLALRNPADPRDPLGPPWLEEVVRDFTALGGIGVVTFVTAAAVGYLFLLRKTHAMTLVLASVVGGWLVSSALKWGFDRPRPDLVPHGSYVMTTSFPSGHSLMSAVTYLTLGALLARFQSSARLKAYILLLAATATTLVGFSRVYLGVHWPTDVLAGWTVGGCWALLCWTLARLLQRRGRVES